MLSVIECGVRSKWLQERRKRVQASDVASIFGVGYAGTNANTVWLDKTEFFDEPMEARTLQDLPTSLQRLEIGLIMEPAIRELFRRYTGLEVLDPIPWSIHVSDEFPLIGATLDGLIVDHPELGRCPLECKAVDTWLGREWAEGRVPLKFQVQAQIQMAATGLANAVLFGLVGGNRPELRVVQRSERFLDAAMPRLEQFWQCVKDRTLPLIDGSTATKDVISTLFPKDNGTAVELPVDALDWAAELELAKEDVKDAEYRKEGAANKLRLAIGAHTYGGVDDKWFSLKTQGTSSGGTCRVLRPIKSKPKDAQVMSLAYDRPAQRRIDDRRTMRAKIIATKRDRLLAQSDRCVWCNTQLDTETAIVDYIVPPPKGLDGYDNLILSCETCFNAKET